MNLSLTQKGAILVLFPLIVQFLLFLALLRMNAANREAQQWAIHTRQVLAQAELLYRYLLGAHSGIRGYVLSDNPEFAAAFRESKSEVPNVLKSLAHLVKDNPTQRQQVAELSERIDAMFEWLDSQHRLVAAGQKQEAIARVQDLSGKKRMEVVRGVLNPFIAEEERLDSERVHRLNEVADLQSWVLIAGGIASFATTMILGMLFFRGIGRRVAVLSDNARRYAEGRELIPPMAGDDEINSVDRSFHDMARLLDSQKQENEMFVYSVSHDLRSPLVNLQGFSQELSHSADDLRGLVTNGEVPESVRKRSLQLLDNNVAKSLKHIGNGVRRLSGIIDALLRLSRAGRVVYQRAEVDIAALVAKVLDSMQGSIAEHAMEVAVKELPSAWGDPNAIEQVFANVIGNAIKYKDPVRPGYIEVGRAEVPAEMRDFNVYYVRDRGLGIPENYQKKVFTVFNRLHPDVAQGEGVGLALVKRVVERHGGKVWLESKAGEGTTFFLALPAAEKALPTPRTDSSSTSPTEKREVPSWFPKR